MLEAHNLSKTFGAHTALKNLSITVPAGETFCFLGANGAGKTTTINLFLGFLEPSAGDARVDGKSVKDDPEAARAVTAYIPEQVALYPELTGFENLAFFARLTGKEVPDELLQASLDRAGLLREAVNRRAATYSKGMRQKVGIAIALAKGAKALLLDEPLSGLDPKAANEFCALLADMRSDGVAILMATHDLFRAREVGDRLGIMKAGELVEVIETKSVTGQQLEEIYLAHMHDGQETAA